MLLNFLPCGLNILTGAVDCVATHRAHKKRYRCCEQENYSFSHNHSVSLFRF